jgi:hypothetical protein
MAKVHTVGIYPEVVGSLWIASSDMSRNTLVKPKPVKESKGSGEPLFTVKSLILEVVKNGWLRTNKFQHLLSPMIRRYLVRTLDPTDRCDKGRSRCGATFALCILTVVISFAGE